MKLNTKKVETYITIDRKEGSARFLVSPMTPKERFDLLKECTEYEWDKGQRFDNINFLKFRLNKILKVIKGWEGIEDKDGKPLECTNENKEIAYMYNTSLIDEVLERLDLLESRLDMLEGESLKNV